MSFQKLVREEILYEISGMKAEGALDFLSKVAEDGCSNGLLTRMMYIADIRKIWEEWYGEILNTTPNLSRDWDEMTMGAIDTVVASVAPEISASVKADMETMTVVVSEELYEYLESVQAFRERDGGIRTLENLAKDQSSPLQKEAEEALEAIEEALEEVEIAEVEYLPIFQRGF